jgi:hypothetical protein
VTQPPHDDDSETILTSSTHPLPENDDMSQDDDVNNDDTYDLEHYKAALSQDAFLHDGILKSYITKTLPSKQDEFQQLHHHAITNHKDPALLENHFKSWQTPHP